MIKWQILVLTHNRIDKVRALLDDLDALLDSRGDVAAVILDNDSDEEGMKKMLTGWEWSANCNRKNLMMEPENHGVALGRNLLAAEINAEFVVFLDDDVRIQDMGFLDRLEEALTPSPSPSGRGGNTKGVGICGPAASLVGWVGDGVSYIPVAGVADVVSGWCLAARAEVVKEFRFDIEYGLFWEEDSDWCLQAKAAGWQVWGTGEIGVEHTPGMSGDKPGLRATNLARLRGKWRGKGVIEGERTPPLAPLP